jgi:hypothetical protein
MAEFIISEKQLQLLNLEILKQDNYRLAEESWSKFSKEEKKQIVETLCVLYPSKGKLVNEAKWYNTLGDIVGIFDPTGVVDLVNGISYLKQGDKLFGLLSIISALPYAGDIVAKPMMAALKIGGPGVKNLRKVTALVEAGKTAEAAKMLDNITAMGGVTGRFVSAFSKIAGKLRGYIERVPMPLMGGLKKTVLQWFDLFANYNKATAPLRKTGQEIVRGMTGLKTATTSVGVWSKAKQLAALEELTKLAKEAPGLFSGYRTTKGILSWKSVFRGMPQLLNRNASVRSLMRQTKWWMGLLDYMNIANFVGPDELAAKIGEDELLKNMENYNKTEEAQNNFESDFNQAINADAGQDGGSGKVGYGQIQPLFGSGAYKPQSSSEKPKENNPVQNMFSNMFSGSLNPLP